MTSRNPNTLMSVPDDQFDYLFKIVLIGDCGTGKTCIVQRLKSGNFIERHGNTIGVDFSMKTLIVDGKKVKVSPFYLIFSRALPFALVAKPHKLYEAANIIIMLQLQIWDTAGQERFRTITQSYYRSANGVIIGIYVIILFLMHNPVC